MIALALALAGAAAYAPVADEALSRRMMHAAFSLSAMRLRERPSCVEAGFDAADRTVGDFLASVLSATANRPSAAPVVTMRAGTPQAGWLPVELGIGMTRGEEEWRWGLRFDMDARTGKVKPSSVQCLVAG